MEPRIAKILNDKIENIALGGKLKRLSIEQICLDQHVLELAKEYEKDVVMVSRMIFQIQKNGTYRDGKFNH